METIVIINHTSHECYLENIDEEVLEKEYGGEEEKYIKDTYDLMGADYTWDYVTNVIDYSKEGEEVEVENVN